METDPTTREAHAVSKLLQAAGNCRQELNLSDSLCSEQKKLRHVLDWAHRFLCHGSEVCREFCRADGLILATEKRKKEEMSPANTYKHVLCGYNTHLQDNLMHITDEVIWPENRETDQMKRSWELQHRSNHQILIQDDETVVNGLHISNQRHQTNVSDRSTNQTSAPAECFKPCWSSVSKSRVFGAVKTFQCDYTAMIYKMDGPEPKGSENQRRKKVEGMMEVVKEKIDVNVEEKKFTSASVLLCDDNDNYNGNDNDIGNFSEPQKEPAQESQMAKPSFPCHLQLPSNVTVYEKHQLCMDQIQNFRVKQNQISEQGCLIELPTKVQKTSKETVAPVKTPMPPTFVFKLYSSSKNPEFKKHGKTDQKVSAAENPEERNSEALNQNRAKTKYNKVVFAECTENLCLKTAEAITSKLTNTHDAEESAARNTYSGLKCHQRGVKGQKRVTGNQLSQRLKEKSRMSLSSLTSGEILLSRCQSAAASEYSRRTATQKRTKRRTSEDRMRQTSPQRDTQTFLQPTHTHKLQYEELTPTSPPVTSAGVHAVHTDSEDGPAGVPACGRWLCLPDEVWLLILSLLPHSDLCRVAQVCSRLHTLTVDPTLWKHLTIENSTLSERRLTLLGRRHPHSLSLYRCSGRSITSNRLEMFFTQCRNYLQKVKVISCTGAGLHGDRILPLIGQLCDHVTTVDVSWSGATDTGVKALSGGCARLRLKAIVLNGCHVTDDPVKKLIMRHKQSLCRLEVFGCQFLTPSCLQSIYKMCPGLKHLNIGHVPKVNAQSLNAMTSQLKCLISLNLTGLQAVTDDTVATLLQSCVKLQSLTLSSCPGVTDLTLHNISRYTPCIRALDLRGCKAVTDAGVQSLTLGCKRLQHLDLSSTSTGNRGLKVLHLYGCAELPTAREIREVNANVRVYPLP